MTAALMMLPAGPAFSPDAAKVKLGFTFDVELVRRHLRQLRGLRLVLLPVENTADPLALKLRR